MINDTSIMIMIKKERKEKKKKRNKKEKQTLSGIELGFENW